MIVLADYIMNVGEDVTRSALKFLNDVEVHCSEDTEDAVSDQDTCCIEDEVVDIHSAEGTTENKGDDKLDELEREANRQRQPKNILRLDPRNEVDAKTKRDGEQDILIDFPNAKFPTERVAITKIEWNKVDIRLEVGHVVFDWKRKYNNIDDINDVDTKHKNKEHLKRVFVF